MSDDPLSDDEFDELDAFLLSDRCPEDAMTMDSLHGFLTAIVIGPEQVAISEWLPHVWGSDANMAPDFQSEQEQERITELILRFLNEIAITFEVAPKEYEPLFCEHDWNGKTLIDGEGWAMGFWEGINLRPAAWEPIWSGETAALMQAFYLLGADEIDEAEAQQIEDPVRRHRLALELEAGINPIRRFWQERKRPSAQAETSRAPKSGSGDELCGCGSGKKFLHCCGARPMLH